MFSRVLFSSALAAMTVTTPTAVAEPAISLYQGRTTKIADTLPDPTDLWVSAADLEAVNGFVLKPEGACLDELCIPVKQDHDSDIFVNRDGRGWLCVTELARRLGQPAVSDSEHRVWSLGQVPSVIASTLESAIAPDFELLDREGNPVRLSQFRGKKVLLVTWASW